MLIAIYNDSPEPLCSQIVQAVKRQLAAGQLAYGDELPPVRDLAALLSINLHTVRHAYKLLEDEQLAVTRLGRRTRITARNNGLPAEAREKLLEQWRQLTLDAAMYGVTAEQLIELFKREKKQ